MSPSPRPGCGSRRWPARALALAALAPGVLAACSLIVNFDPEGQPCSSTGCLSGYTCDKSGGAEPGVCTKGGSSDAGPRPPCGGPCLGGQICLGGRDVCANVADCSTVACPVGEVCAPATRICQRVPDRNIGEPCNFDSECDVGGTFCAGSSAYDARPDGGFGPRRGFCTKFCAATCPLGSSCIQVTTSSHKATVGLCLVAEVQGATDPLLVAPLPCAREVDCIDFPGLTCTVFDNPNLPDALTFCDHAVDGGVGRGEMCQRSAPPLPMNGICLPDRPGESGKVGLVCAALSDCPTGETCQEVEYITRNNVVRRLDACAAPGAPSQCRSCATDRECGSDAPHCVTITAGQPFCRIRCSTATAPCDNNDCRAVADAGYCQGNCP